MRKEFEVLFDRLEELLQDLRSQYQGITFDLNHYEFTDYDGKKTVRGYIDVILSDDCELVKGSE